MNYQTFVLGAAGDIKDELPSGLEGFGTEEHWESTVKQINSSTSMCSSECLMCCPCFVMMMVCGGGVEKHLSQKVHRVMIKLNRDHYNDDEVFSNEGLKVCFDRNKVSRDFYTKGTNGQLLLDERKQQPQQQQSQQQQSPGQNFTVFNGGPNRPMQAPVQQAPIQQVPVQQIPVQQVQMQARPTQVVPVYTQQTMQQPMQQQPIYQQPMQQQQQPMYHQPMQQQQQPMYHQQPLQQQQQPMYHHQQPQQMPQQHMQYQQPPPQQQMHRPQVQQQPPQQQHNNQGVGQGIIPTIATIGTIPVVASSMM